MEAIQEDTGARRMSPQQEEAELAGLPPPPPGLPPPPPPPTFSPEVPNSPLVPSSPDSPNAKHDVPQLDMKKYTRQRISVVPQFPNHEGDAEHLGTEDAMVNQRKRNVSTFDNNKSDTVNKIIDMFPVPPNNEPDEAGWSEDGKRGSLAELKSKKDERNTVFRQLLNFSRCDISQNEVESLCALMKSSKEMLVQENLLKELVERAFQVAVQDAGVSGRAIQMKKKGGRLIRKVSKGFSSLFKRSNAAATGSGSRSNSGERQSTAYGASSSHKTGKYSNIEYLNQEPSLSNNDNLYVTMDSYNVKITGSGGVETEIDQKASTVFHVINKGKKTVYFVVNPLVEKDAMNDSYEINFDVEDSSALAFVGDDDVNHGKGFVCVKKHEAVSLVVSFTARDGDLDVFVPFEVSVVCGPKMLGVVSARVAKSYFGVNPQKLPVQTLPSGHLIPKVLVDMRRYLVENGGLDQEGIFRLAADEVEMAEVRRKLNQNRFESCKDINCISTLIKVWFRKLPKQLFGSIDPELVLKCKSEEDALGIYNQIDSPYYRGIILWLLDLMGEVAACQDKNKMSVQNCAIVMGPNLFSTDQVSNPMQALMIAQKSVGLLKFLIEWRMKDTAS
jgi:hypothetical protein